MGRGSLTRVRTKTLSQKSPTLTLPTLVKLLTVTRWDYLRVFLGAREIAREVGTNTKTLIQMSCPYSSQARLLTRGTKLSAQLNVANTPKFSSVRTLKTKDGLSPPKFVGNQKLITTTPRWRARSWKSFSILTRMIMTGIFVFCI